MYTMSRCYLRGRTPWWSPCGWTAVTHTRHQLCSFKPAVIVPCLSRASKRKYRNVQYASDFALAKIYIYIIVRYYHCSFLDVHRNLTSTRIFNFVCLSSAKGKSQVKEPTYLLHRTSSALEWYHQGIVNMSN